MTYKTLDEMASLESTEQDLGNKLKELDTRAPELQLGTQFFELSAFYENPRPEHKALELPLEDLMLLADFALARVKHHSGRRDTYKVVYKSADTHLTRFVQDYERIRKSEQATAQDVQTPRLFLEYIRQKHPNIPIASSEAVEQYYNVFSSIASTIRNTSEDHRDLWMIKIIRYGGDWSNLIEKYTGLKISEDKLTAARRLASEEQEIRDHIRQHRLTAEFGKIYRFLCGKVPYEKPTA